ncbi:MAG: TIGR00730 family Rossman fold protein [Clostridia bacterium]
MKLCIFGSSCETQHREFYDDAFEVGKLLAKNGITLVFGAGATGLMGASAEGASALNGEIIGIIPEKLNLPGIATPLCTKLIVTKTMHERKAEMERIADGFIALPGGFGTFDELMGVTTLKQLDYIDLPICVMNTLGYYEKMFSQFDAAFENGFVEAKFKSLIYLAKTPKDAIGYCLNYKKASQPPKMAEALITELI